MPFFDTTSPGVVKTQLTLLQIGLGEPGSSRFRCPDAFAWSEFLDTPPDPLDVVAAGSPTDLASIPPFLWGFIPSYGSHTMSAVLHDVQCDGALRAPTRAHGAWLRRRADGLFRRTLREDAKVGGVTHWIMWAAVRLFGDPKVGGALGAGVVLGLLHWSQPLFARVADALGALTIWPWLSFLEWIPQWVSRLLAWLAAWLAPEPRFLVVFGITALAFVGFAALRSVESSAPSGPGRFAPSAFLELLAAGVIGVLAAPPLLPLILVTALAGLLRMLLDLIAFVATWVVNRFRPDFKPTARPELDIFPGP